jgi:hypothetical protein
MVLPFPFRAALAAGIALMILTGCDELIPPQAAAAPAEVAPTAAATPAATPATTPAQAPARAGLTREGAQVVTLDIRNQTDGVIVSLTATEAGRASANLLAPGTGIPAGGTYPLPAAPGTYVLQAELQAPSVFTRGRQIQRTVIVPRFPPNPPPRLQVTLR